ncbi:MAG TPA: SprT-like domain-containing protein [Ferruginibacter sp.]|nr:SprT-like domain-containing protein [Ferruginibacter sp.]HRN80374.1 SprT-like domain-containing protein [Ferruginibacter sp.]HRO18744.1 SprT-like domain-containing protein [Ferruginibacter sp.]HRQ21780.1 SprT-like domain-containing protein [Ferruginibacter sp.]
MPKKEVPLTGLKKYLPEGSYDLVMDYIFAHRIELTVTRKRNTLLGDYRSRTGDKNHRISVNGNLNPYNFLVTFLHELAHLLTFERYGHRIQPHGKEWKAQYASLLQDVMYKNIFPEPIVEALKTSIRNPGASTCGDTALLRVLKQYDEDAHALVHVEDVPHGALFTISGNRVFRKGEKVRTRYKCQEISNGKWFLFNGLYEVEQTDSASCSR